MLGVIVNKLTQQTCSGVGLCFFELLFKFLRFFFILQTRLVVIGTVNTM